MSLFFNERIDEQQKEEEDRLKNKVTFTYPWIIRIPSNGNNDQSEVKGKFGTCYKFGYETWYMKIIRNNIRIGTYVGLECEPHHGFDTRRQWNGSCYLSYNLYYDNDMRFLYYSSRRIRMDGFVLKDLFETPDGFMTKYFEAVNERKIARMVVSIELHLPLKLFYRPFEKPWYRNEDVYAPYPSNVSSNFRYSTFNDNDYTIKCPDGTVPCRRIILNIASEFFTKHFKTSNDKELAVEHSIDVVKPIVIFLRTRYFEMPKFFDLDYVRRLFAAIAFFVPLHGYIGTSVHRGLCSKFVSEDHDFDSILQWTKFACQGDLEELETIIATVIAEKFYFKWQETFPQAAQNVENPLFLDIFGPVRTEMYMRRNDDIFRTIEEIFKESFFTNVIIP